MGLRWCAAAAVVLCACAAHPQQTAEGYRSGESSSHVPFAQPQAMPPPQNSAAAAADRQKKIQEDAARIAQLSSELQEAVDKAGPNQLSVDAFKKASEIERLSKEMRALLKQ